MTSAAFIPIKSNSTRVPGKNFKPWKGRPLYQWIINRTLDAGCFDDIFVDTDSVEIADYAIDCCVNVIRRVHWLTADSANGNDLIVHHATEHPQYDAYFQLFATAPELRAETIADCVKRLRESPDHDSILTGRRVSGWFWLTDRHPLYRPDILPRSQDWQGVWQESTGLYGITRQAVQRYRQRIGANPIFHEITAQEMCDIDYPEDFDKAV